jgi:hypothetical protein
MEERFNTVNFIGNSIGSADIGALRLVSINKRTPAEVNESALSFLKVLQDFNNNLMSVDDWIVGFRSTPQENQYLELFL